MTKVSNSTSPITPTSAVATTPSSPLLTSADFPALQVTAAVSTVPSSADSNSNNVLQEQAQGFQQSVDSDDTAHASTSDKIAKNTLTEKELAKAERKAAKKAAAAERAAERQRIAQEKTAAKLAEKERIAAEKAAEKERVVREKAEAERLAKEKAEKEPGEKLDPKGTSTCTHYVI